MRRMGAMSGRRAMRFGRVVAVAILSVPVAHALAQSIQDQRARLPPAVSCADPVEGVWMSHRYFAESADWYVTQFEVHRAPGSPSALVGHIVAEHFNTPPDQPEPAPCGTFPGYHHRI